LAVTEPLVLLADDEPNLRETVSFLLEMEGFRVELANDGVEALEKVKALRPAVVLLDAMMPRRDGFDVCRTIRADPDLAAVRIVMVTALSQRTDRERALEAGADYFVSKPFDEDALLAALRTLTS
jgi:CheY-like chemotaxis protein